MTASRSRAGVAVLMSVLGIAVAGAVAEHATEWGESPNDDLVAIGDAVEAIGRDGDVIGYSGYWTAHIVTFLTDSDVEVLAIECDRSARSVPFEWMADMSRFDRAQTNPRSRSFVVIDRTELSLTCPPDLLAAQHGAPDRILAVGESGDYEIWVYERDIGTDLPAAGDL